MGWTPIQLKARAGKKVMEMAFTRLPGDPFMNQSNAIAASAEPEALRPTPAVQRRVGSPHEGGALGERSMAARLSSAAA